MNVRTVPSVLKLRRGNENNSEIIFLILNESKGWSGGAKVLRKSSVPGRPTSLDNSRARATAPPVGAEGGCLDIFSLLYRFILRVLETARYRLKYCLKWPLNPKQPTNQPSMKVNIVTPY